jgi:hypothetical protein
MPVVLDPNWENKAVLIDYSVSKKEVSRIARKIHSSCCGKEGEGRKIQQNISADTISWHCSN